VALNCTQHPLFPPKVVAIATDRYLKPDHPFPDAATLGGSIVPRFGQDITSSVNRAAPGNASVGKTANELMPKMHNLLTSFAAGDRSGMAHRLIDSFLQKQSEVTCFEDPALNAAAAKHLNIVHFCSSSLSAPNSPQNASGRRRIHQALKEANWDIKKLLVPNDLGVPAFNIGSKLFSTEDFRNGLGLMINGVQHAYVVAKNYQYDKSANRYCIGLKYVFYDVFGLDDDDLMEFGAKSDASLASAVGITAWWQLQHQHGYAPLVTRIVVEKSFEAPAT